MDGDKLIVAVVGGGAAGFFAAIRIAEMQPDAEVHIFEQSKQVLQKVKISGGGRCNVTHACFDPAELIAYYPRGGRELLGPFHKFGPAECVDWFESRGVKLKTEADGRMFPVSDNSQTIINCLTGAANNAGVQLHISTGVKGISYLTQDTAWQLVTTAGKFNAHKLLFTTGGNTQIWEMLQRAGHRISKPVPSLFTFNSSDSLLHDLAGISVPDATLMVKEIGLTTNGPLLITHSGLSGPAVLKLSAWGARDLNKVNYQFNLMINWLGGDEDTARNMLQQKIQENRDKQVLTPFLPGIPKRLWQRVISRVINDDGVRWKQLTPIKTEALINQLIATTIKVQSKSTFKEEFVTAGGVQLNEVDFRTMQSKVLPGMYFAGEVLDIDAVTGGFNFQNAWTTAWLAAGGITKSA